MGRLLAVVLCLVSVSGCNGVTPPGAPTATPSGTTAFGATAPRILTPAHGVGGDPAVGRQLFGTKGCAGCHTLAGVPGAVGVTGPNLTNIALRPTLAGDTIPNTPETLERWLLNPQALKPGTTMPTLGLTDQEATNLVAFLESQPHNPEP